MAKLLSVCLRTKWFWVRVQLQSLKLQISHLLRARSSLTFRQLLSLYSFWNPYMTWQEYTVSSLLHCPIISTIFLHCNCNVSKYRFRKYLQNFLWELLLCLEPGYQLRKNRKHKDYSDIWMVDGFSMLSKDSKIRS